MSTQRDRIEAKLGLAGPPLRPVRDAPPCVPDHELVRRIGQGSYGEVWLARSALGTWRAVKIVYRDTFKDARPYEREFAGIRRFEPLSRSNEGFVDILQVGRDDVDGWFYYVMELADDAAVKKAKGGKGEEGIEDELVVADACFSSSPFPFGSPAHYTPRTLSFDLHHRGRLPLDDCLQLGLTLSFALGHLHRHGLIHRDVKPSNIIFMGGVPKLADIGLVTEAAGANTFVGTEGFVPPEGPTSPQADIYALGKVLYEAAMGKDRNEFPEPFTQISTDHESIALMELNTILLRACAPDPKTRYASAEEMHADLALLHSGGSVKRRHLFERQFRIAKQVGAGAVTASLLIGAAWFWQNRQTEQMTQLASEKATLANEKTKLADNLTKLGEENRQRIVRLDIANGVRLLDEGDPAGALLWFADALPLVSNKPAEESIHRIRIQQTLYQMPRPAQILAHEHPVRSLAFSPDGKLFATGTEWGWVQLWDVQTGALLWKPLRLESDGIPQVGFTPDGQRLLVSTVLGGDSTVLGGGLIPSDRMLTTSAAVIAVATGQRLFTKIATNLAQAAFIAGGRWFVTTESDHVIRVLDVRDGSQVAALKGHTNRIMAFASSTSARGDLLASTSADGTIRLWRLPSGEPVGPPLPFHPPQHFPVLSADGKRLATRERIVRDGITNELIRLWSTETLSSVGKPIEAPGISGSMWFDSAPSQRLFSLFGTEGRVFDADTQAELLPAIQLDKPMGNWAATQDGCRLMVGGRDGVAGLWSLETGEQLAPPFRHGRQILDLAFSPDGSRFATTTDESTCVLWKVNLRREDAVHRFNANTPSIRRGPPQRLLKCFSPDRRRFLIPLDDGTARLVDVEQMAEQEMPGLKPASVEPRRCLFAPDNHQWAIAYSPTNEQGSSFVELWRDEAGTLKRQMLPHPTETQNTGFAPRRAMMEMWSDETGTGRYSDLVSRWTKIRSMRFGPGSASLITVSDDRQIRTWRTADGTLERSVTAPQTIDESGELFPDGRTIFVLDRVVGFGLFDLVTGGMMPTPIPPANVTALAFDASGERFVTVTEQQWGRVWSTKTGAPLSPTVRHDGVLTWVDWSPDGKRIAMAGVTPEIRVWDASTGDLSLPPLRIGDKALGTVMWSLDGRFIVARSGEKAVRVWEAATGEPVTPLLKHSGFVHLANLVANNRLVTLSLPNVMRAWDLTETRLTVDVIADYAKLVAGRRLNAAGVMLPLKSDELAELSRSLRTHAPQLFE